MHQKIFLRVVVVAQLVERSLPTPKVHGLNPVIGKLFIEHLFTVNCIEKTEIKIERPRIAHFENTLFYLT